MRSLVSSSWLLAALALALVPGSALATDAGDDGGVLFDDGGLYSDAGAPDGGDADGGLLVVDAGYDAGSDAGPQLPAEEGFGCTPGDGANCGALFCVPYPTWPDYGVCRMGCETNDDCFAGRTCQDIVDKASFETLYSACVPPVSWRDGACHAPLDPDTCAGDMSCHIARGSDSVDGVSFHCKVTCDVSESDSADGGQCGAGERCAPSRFVQAFQTNPNNPNATVACTPALCDDDAGSCECAEGFGCTALEGGANLCAVVPGECKVPVRGVVPGDIADGGFLPFEVLCNESSDHRYCDNEPFEGVPNAGANLCIFEGQLGVADEGLCLPYCGVVDVDQNGNGTLEVAERGQLLGCPEGEQCTRRLAREMLLGPGPAQAGGPYGLRGCTLEECPAGTICPACGPGQPECMPLPEPVGAFTGLCIGPVLTCEAAPDYDAGPPPFVDAGPAVEPGTDAGSDPPVGPLDAGPSGADGGPDDDDDDDDDRRLGASPGPTVTTDGCACATSDSPADGLGLLGLLSLVVVLRRRRRRRS